MGRMRVPANMQGCRLQIERLESLPLWPADALQILDRFPKDTKERVVIFIVLDK